MQKCPREDAIVQKQNIMRESVITLSDSFIRI